MVDCITAVAFLATSFKLSVTLTKESLSFHQDFHQLPLLSLSFGFTENLRTILIFSQLISTFSKNSFTINFLSSSFKSLYMLL
jgi:hypothetical protein